MNSVVDHAIESGSPQTEFGQNKLPPSNPLSRKLSRILHLPLDDPENIDALATIAKFYTENTLSARRNLKSIIDQKIIAENAQFLAAFDLVQQQLDSVGKHINEIGDKCKTIDDQIKSAFISTSAVIKHTQELKAKSASCLERKEVIEAFLRKFTLSETEIRTLTTSNDNVDSSFFNALKHAQQIQEDCKSLLASENEQLGLEIMETTTMYLNTAFERLVRWVQAECRLMKSEAPEITVELKEGVRMLKLRPILFQNCMEDISNARRSALVRGFQDALTVGGPNGFPRPIDFHAHDTLRYTGDILAWIHQACVGEREMLEGLFDLQSLAFRRRSQRAAIQLRSNPTSPTNQSGAIQSAADATSPLDEMEGWRIDEELLLQVLDKSVETLSHPLQTRIQSVLRSGLGPITSYRVANLIQFYSKTIDGVIGTFSKLSVMLKELTQVSFQVFFETLNAQAADMLRFVQSPDQDLQPPQAVKDTILQLREIMMSYDGSLLNPEDREGEFHDIMISLMDPVLQMCVLGSNHLKPIESAIYMVNCLHQIQSAVSAFTFTQKQVHLLDQQIESQTQVLVDEQYSAILMQSGLSALARHMSQTPPPLSHHSQTSPNVISECMSKLDVFLITVTVDVSDTLSRITSMDIARLVAKRGFQRFIETYRDVVNKIYDPANKYEFPSTLVTRTVEDVETLLSLQDV